MHKYIGLALCCLISFRTLAVEKIELLPYQAFPVDYLYSSEQKGLLINHSLGSGKTILALGLAERYPERSVYIIVPSFLKSNWAIIMERYGIKNKPNYVVLSYEEAAEQLGEVNLEGTIVIVDEVHKIVARMKSPLSSVRKAYVKLYCNLRKAHKILALTGTPLYQDATDLSYILNLVAGKNVMPFNENQFKLKYTKINRGRALWRGHITESIFLQSLFPSFCSFYGLSFVTTQIPSTWVGFALGAGSSIAIHVINAAVRLDDYPLRTLDADKFKNVARQYVSFYEVQEEDKKNYPAVIYDSKDIPLSEKEYRFLLKFADKGLNRKELAILLSDSQEEIDPNDLTINSTLTQENLLNVPGVGREISNIIFDDAEGNPIYPNKFKELLTCIRKENYPMVVYSNFNRLGIMNLARFLDDHGYKDQYKLLEPNLPVQEQIKIIRSYNEGKVNILLLHPEITEGVSLNGTQEFHILEQVLNSALLDQIIGRVIRYKSHIHLPPDKQKVRVVLWNAEIGFFNPNHIKQKAQNWRMSFSELNDLSKFGQGRVQIDKNDVKKVRSADQAARVKIAQLTTEMTNLKNVFRRYSIESIPSVVNP